MILGNEGSAAAERDDGARSRVVRRAVWVDDGDMLACGVCRSSFNMLVRQHHCRRCGRIFCIDCVQYKCLVPPEELALPPIGSWHLENLNPCEPQRVCTPCAHLLLPFQSELKLTIAQAAQEIQVDPVSMERYLNTPLNFHLDEEIRKATFTVLNLTDENLLSEINQDKDPAEVLANAAGLAFLTIAKAGFFFSGRVGSGLVIGRTSDGGWSAPSSIMIVGAGWGMQVGGEVTDTMIVLHSRNALETFTSSAQASMGTMMGVAAGSLGRNVSGAVHGGEEASSPSTIFSFNRSRGLYVGMSLEAGLLLSRPDLNKAFYGCEVPVKELLSGLYPVPRGAAPLYEALNKASKGRPPARHLLPDQPAPMPDGGLAPDENDAWSSERDRRLSLSSSIADFADSAMEAQSQQRKALYSSADLGGPCRPEAVREMDTIRVRQGKPSSGLPRRPSAEGGLEPVGDPTAEGSSPMALGWGEGDDPTDPTAPGIASTSTGWNGSDHPATNGNLASVAVGGSRGSSSSAFVVADDAFDAFDDPPGAFDDPPDAPPPAVHHQTALHPPPSSPSPPPRSQEHQQLPQPLLQDLPHQPSGTATTATAARDGPSRAPVTNGTVPLTDWSAVDADAEAAALEAVLNGTASAPRPDQGAGAAGGAVLHDV